MSKTSGIYLGELDGETKMFVGPDQDGDYQLVKDGTTYGWYGNNQISNPRPASIVDIHGGIPNVRRNTAFRDAFVVSNPQTGEIVGDYSAQQYQEISRTAVHAFAIGAFLAEEALELAKVPTLDQDLETLLSVELEDFDDPYDGDTTAFLAAKERLLAAVQTSKISFS